VAHETQTLHLHNRFAKCRVIMVSRPVPLGQAARPHSHRRSELIRENWSAMKISSSESLLRSAAGVCLTLLVCLVIAPSHVQAGCSSHLVYDPTPGLGSELIDQFIRVGTSAPINSTSPRGTPKQPPSCSGPSCSKLPALPTPPSVAETRYIEVWALLEPLVPLPSLKSTLFPPAHRDFHTIHVGPSIFHPPRFLDSRRSA